MNQILEAQLAASCGNVVAFLASKCRRDAIVLQDAQKAFLRPRRRDAPNQVP